jgi:hypothetical protein
LLFNQEDSIGLVQRLSSALASEAVTGDELKRMKVLGNVFNNLDQSSPSRFDAYVHGPLLLNFMFFLFERCLGEI